MRGTIPTLHPTPSTLLRAGAGVTGGKGVRRRFGYALLASLSGTERNPEFERAVKEATKGKLGRPILVICGRGGTLETVVERKGPKAKKFKDPQRTAGIASR